VVALGFFFGGGPVQNILGSPLLCGTPKNLRAPSMRKCDSVMFRVHQYTNQRWAWTGSRSGSESDWSSSPDLIGAGL